MNGHTAELSIKMTFGLLIASAMSLFAVRFFQFISVIQDLKGDPFEFPRYVYCIQSSYHQLCLMAMFAAFPVNLSRWVYIVIELRAKIGEG